MRFTNAAALARRLHTFKPLLNAPTAFLVAPVARATIQFRQALILVACTTVLLSSNSSAFQPTLAAVIDGSTVSVPTFGPTSNIPEPSSLTLAVLGLIGAGPFAWRRARRLFLSHV